MLMTRQNELYSPIGKKLRRGVVEAYNEVFAEYALKRHMVKQIMVHHKNGIFPVLFRLLCLSANPIQLIGSQTVLRGFGMVAAVKRNQPVFIV